MLLFSCKTASVYQLYMQPKIYNYINNIHISVSNISRIYNISIVILMLTAVTFIISLSKLKKISKVIMILPIFFFLITADPQFCFNMYCKLYYGDYSSAGETLAHFVRGIFIFDSYILYVYFFIIAIFLFSYYINTKIFIRKKHTILSAIAFSILTAFTVFTFEVTPVKNYKPINTDLLKFPLGTVVWKDFYVSIFAALVVIISVAVILLWSRPFYLYPYRTKKELQRNALSISQNVRMILHIQKNVFFTIEQLAIQAKNYIDTKKEISENNINKIINISLDSTHSLSKMLNMLRETTISYELISLNDCISEAAEKALASRHDIHYVTNFSYEYSVLCNKIHLTELFVNIFNNAADAIDVANKTDKEILVNLDNEDKYVIIEITDNGCGIDKKLLSKIFDPFFSTKNNSANWGIGLNYASKIIKLYNGNIQVKSELNKYTIFQIILPLISKSNSSQP